jgi:hypothetical protein
MEGKGKKPAPTKNELDKLIQRINYINSLHDITLYVCGECGQLNTGTGTYLAITDSCDYRSFCPACVLHCDYCQDDYSHDMAYRHEDCPVGHPDHLTDHVKKVFGLALPPDPEPPQVLASPDSEPAQRLQTAKPPTKRKRTSKPIVID